MTDQSTRDPRIVIYGTGYHGQPLPYRAVDFGLSLEGIVEALDRYIARFGHCF
jgi:hypothetical protein